MFEAVQFIERRGAVDPDEMMLGDFAVKRDAIDAARAARDEFVEAGSEDYAWWIVRKQGARLANFIADSKSNKEFVLDLRSGELLEVPSQ